MAPKSRGNFVAAEDEAGCSDPRFRGRFSVSTSYTPPPMRFRRLALLVLKLVLKAVSLAVLLTGLVTGCAPPLGRVLVTVVFENETRTQCIKASARNASGASINSNPSSLPREGKDTLRIGLGETGDLAGELQVTISRFSTPDCGGTAFDTETQAITVVRGAPTATLEFRFIGMTAVDGGSDGGADAGPDAGCDVGACGNAPRECELAPAIGCSADGGCRFSFRSMLTPCGDGGVCNSMGACIANLCAVAAPGTTCDDDLPCTATSSCVSGVCQGTCGAPPLCKLLVQPFTCDLVTPTACQLRNGPDDVSCGAASLCFDGGCTPWLPFAPLNFTSTPSNTPYPTGPWNLASPDGGVCDTVISTAGSTAAQQLGACGSPPLTSTINDAGVMVITATGLDVGPNARLHFVGDKPVQLVVLGSASIRGVVSVAPLLGQRPAGSDPVSCIDASAGMNARQAGGGGGFGGTGGLGGEGGASGGGAAPSLTPFRGGCPGAHGFRVDGGISPPGLGGGALHLIVADNLSLDGGIVTASGGGGEGGALDDEGAGGGGSGGTVILEARNINLNNGALTANGGGGGEGGAASGAGLAGALGPISSQNAAPAADGPGNGGVGGVGGDNATPNGGVGGTPGGARGGGGGGGSVGVVYLESHGGTCTRGNGVISGNASTMSISCQ